MLVRSWLETDGLRDHAAWVSVEHGERDAPRFWLSVLDAFAGVLSEVQRVDPGPGVRGEVVVDQLLMALDSLEEAAVLVIDDLHELRSTEALAQLERFLGRLPPGLRVALATREDPRLGLHRLRLAGELMELRAPELRFSSEETEAVLLASGIALSDRAVALLHERTEGWAAGVRLAAISLGQHPDPEQFVTEFSGSERTVAGYLLAEVLERQPPEVRDLLLRSSVLDRVSGPLADYLTRASGSERILQELEEANAFVSALDAGRSWFRYHRLFADLLQLELRRAAPTSIGPLHRAAARWHAEEGDPIEAIRHAQAARDWAMASRLLSHHHLDLILDGRMETVCQLLSTFPADVAAADAELALVFGTARLMDQQRDEGASYLDLAERLVDTVPVERRRRFDVLLAVLRLLLARWRGDLQTVQAAIHGLETALAALPERELGDALRSAALQNLGVAELWSSRLPDARRDLEKAIALARRVGRPWLEVPCLGHLGIAAPWTGSTLSEGLGLSEAAVRIVDAHGWGEDPIIVTALATGVLALLWLGRLDEAERWLERAERTVHPEGEPATELLVHHVRGLLHLAREQFDAALESLQASQHMQAFLTDRHPFALRTKARLLQTHARMGRLDAARAALADIGEVERGTPEIRIAAAIIHLTASETEQALDVLGPVLSGAVPTLHPPSWTTEAQVLDALAHDQLGDRRAAEASLERALELAEPEGIVLPFILHRTQDLLESLPKHRTAHATLQQTILDVFAGAAPRPGGKPAPLLDELSDAELRVVRYLPSNLKAPEIASELCVSPNTVRTHLRHIYAKLDAHDRNQAVARARELSLLAPSSHVR
ncbi:MAG TPA: LuxR C-terminal-related transcriptional regulator [Solirubrobacteraceae bacterium]|nr:LuxR C-terminal-related transcriptional regulator [Solirubrobacteraceae bacterium]